MKKKAYGLSEKGVEIAILADESTAPTESDWISLGKCYKDSATIEEDDGEEIDCECEELDDPEDTQYTSGKTKIKYSTTDLDPESCASVFGGTVTDVSGKKKWERPKNLNPRLIALRFTTRTGLKVSFAKCKMRSKFNWPIKKNGYGQLDHTISAMSPISIEEE